MRNESRIAEDEGAPGGAGEVEALVQFYRCPQGHVSDIVWTTGEILVACETNEVRFWCARCRTTRFATEPEATSLLAAFGLAPALRIYSS